MGYISAFREVMRDYDRLRDKARALQTTRLNELYAKQPRLIEIDRSLMQTGISVSRAILSGSSAVKMIEEIKARNLALNKEKQEIITGLGYRSDYLTDIYRCKDCDDTGFVENAKCRCLRQRLIDKYYDLSGLEKVLAVENFDAFDFRFYSTEIDPAQGISPSSNIHTIYATCMDFINNFDNSFLNLLFYGETGLGKTFLCNCIAKDLMDVGKTVLYVTAPRIFKKIEDFRFKKDELDSSDDQLEMIFEVDLLIIDDLGSEFPSGVTNPELFNIINSRILDKRPTIISTNLSISEFQSSYSDRLVSRFFGNFKMLKFFGEDIRVKKKLSGISAR